MKPVSLHVSGYSRFPECDLELPAGTVALVGANGAGKSRLLNAIELALYARGSVDLAPWLSPWTDRLEILLTFEHHGELYRVRQGYRVGAGGRGTATVDLERLANPIDVELGASDTWEPLSRENADATRALIVDTVGLSRRAFRASSFLAQKDAGAFTEATPADRRAVLGEVCDPRGVWPALTNAAHARARTVDAAITTDRALALDREERAAELPGLRDASATLERQQAEARAELAEAERTHQDAQDAATANDTAAERHRAARQAVEHARAEHARAVTDATTARTAASHATQATARLAELEVTVDGIPYLEERAREQRELALAVEHAEKRRHDAQVAVGREQQAAVQIEERWAAANGRLVHLTHSDPGTERCDVCRQLLGVEALQAAAAATEAEVARLAAELAVAESRCRTLAVARDDIVIPEPPAKDWTAELAAARRCETEHASLAGKLPLLEQAASRAPELEQAARTAEATLAERQAELTATAEARDPQPLHQAVLDTRAAVNAARTALEELVRDHATTATRVAAAEQAATELAEARARIAAAETRLTLLRLAERAYGRDGIPVLLTENVIPLIEAEANRILQQMPTDDGTVFTVELHTQRAQKGDATKTTETLDILVAEPDTTRAYESFSGGEQGRLNIALRIALARLLAGRRGAESRLLAIDEIPYLDDLGQAQLVDVIRGVAASFDTTIVIAHDDILRDAFDHVLRLEKRDGVSELATAQDAEAVAA